MLDLNNKIGKISADLDQNAELSSATTSFSRESMISSMITLGSVILDSEAPRSLDPKTHGDQVEAPLVYASGSFVDTSAALRAVQDLENGHASDAGTDVPVGGRYGGNGFKVPQALLA